MKPKKTVKKTANKIYSQEKFKSELLYFIPVIFAIAVVPLIVYMKTYTLQGIQREIWSGGEKAADFFSYYKYIWLIIATVAGAVSLLIKRMNNDLIIKKTYAYIPIAVYILFVLLSTMLSQYKDVATRGFVERYEGVYVLLAYVTLAVVTLNLVSSEKHLKYIINALLMSSAILGLIGLSQYLGLDFFGTSFGKQLILPTEYQSAAGSMKFKFDKFTVYATLYNPNYVGSYVVLVLPICIGLLIYSKRIAKKIISALLICVLFLSLLGSGSMAGFIGLIAAAVFLAIFFRRAIFKYIKPVAIVCAVLLVLLAGVNYLSGGAVIQRINILDRLSESGQDPGAVYVKDIAVKNNMINFITDKQSVSLLLNNGEINFYDGNDDALAVKTDQNVITFENPEYSMFKFEKTDQGLINCFIGGKAFQIAISRAKFKLIGLHGKLIDPQHPDKINVDGHESALTARAFIWSRTIPLLKDTLLVGHGPDTFPIYFPQDDIVGKLNAYGTTNILVDKPHNLYLQLAVNTGVLSVLAFISLFLIYFISSFKLYFKKNITEYKDYIGICIFCGICGYCVTGLANDSAISVAPVFWVLLGLGLACNMLAGRLPDNTNRQKNKKADPKTNTIPKSLLLK